MTEAHTGASSWQSSQTGLRDLPGSTQERVAEAIASFGAAVLPKLTGVGQPEDQMRSPLENLLRDVATTLGLSVNPIGEASLADLRVRADYAIEVDGALAGYIEVKAPGKGADPSRWSTKSHDRRQWEKLRRLPNVLYTDGDEWALYRAGERVGEVARLDGGVRSAGADLTPSGPGLAIILDSFLRWRPIAPRSLGQLVNAVAGLCRLLRDEVDEAMALEKGKGGPFTRLAADWRELLFPDADDSEFADGYAQTVTFALLLARVDRIDFTGQPVGEIARQLGKGHSLMGKALDVLTDYSLGTLTRTIDTLLRVIGAVEWERFERSKRDPYLHLYERFLEVYDPDLRKETGSYYTPGEVVQSMISLVDEALKTELDEPLGFASDDVVVVDPAMGTGTYLLSVLEQAATAITSEEGVGAVPARLRRMTERVIGFEKQAGPFAVAEMRSYGALRRWKAEVPKDGLRLYVADTLDNPEADQAHMYAGLEPIARSRRAANEVKKNEPVVVVVGNPPYRDKARGLGGWIESGNIGRGEAAPMDAFRAPGKGKLEYVLSNLYTYFWRWATWKVFDHNPTASLGGVVAFITPSGFTSGPGFAGMREYLRREADKGWIIDLTPEGHQPDVSTRIFPGVQQPLCIAIFLRKGPDAVVGTPAEVRITHLSGHRQEKFTALSQLTLNGSEWELCESAWQEPFRPARSEDWDSYPALPDLFPWSSPGVKTERAWVISPDTASLRERWRTLLRSPEAEARDRLLHVSRNRSSITRPEYLPGTSETGGRMKALADEPTDAMCPAVLPYGFRSFDRQHILADHRLMYPARPDLWAARSNQQLFMIEQHAQPVTSGPGVVFSDLLPDMHYFNGRGGRAFPLYSDGRGERENVAPGLLAALSRNLGVGASAEDLMAYAACVMGHPLYVETFRENLRSPGNRLPITGDANLFKRAVSEGQYLLWLHSFGERFVSPSENRPQGVPRLPKASRPYVEVAIPGDTEGFPETITYDPSTRSLVLGEGVVQPVEEEVWNYDVGGVAVVKKWFSYRKKVRGGRKSSDLDDLRPDAWVPEWTTDLLNLLNVLGLVVSRHSQQAALLEEILQSELINRETLTESGVVFGLDGIKTGSLGSQTNQIEAF